MLNSVFITAGYPSISWFINCNVYFYLIIVALKRWLKHKRCFTAVLRIRIFYWSVSFRHWSGLQKINQNLNNIIFLKICVYFERKKFKDSWYFLRYPTKRILDTDPQHCFSGAKFLYKSLRNLLKIFLCQITKHSYDVNKEKRKNQICIFFY